MFSHIMIGSNDIARSKTFYDALFSTIGGSPGTQDPKGRPFPLFRPAMLGAFIHLLSPHVPLLDYALSADDPIEPALDCIEHLASDLRVRSP